MCRQFSLLCLLLFLNQSLLADGNRLQLLISGKNYEDLKLKVVFNGNTFEYIQGNNIDTNMWEFHIPDSVYEYGQKMKLVVPSSNDSIIHELSLCYLVQQDTIRTPEFYIGKKFSKLSINYIERLKWKRVSYMNYKDLIYDCYSVSINDSEFESGMAKWQMKLTFRRGSYSFEDKLDKYISLVKKYPNSHSLITELYIELNRYKSKNDVESIFSYFSDMQKNSYYGQLINTYLYNKKFPNIELRVLGDERMEAVIGDPFKENLVIFTASWCSPCHKLIPVLKDIYSKLGNKMDFTYISIDDSRTIDRWQKVIQENEIPWRCLIATDKLDKVKEEYTVLGIPLTYRVFANGTFEKINLQNSEERDKLVQEIISK